MAQLRLARCYDLRICYRRSVTAFRDAATACDYAEGIDVTEGLWQFFADDGTALVPVFSRPSKRGFFSVRSGEYSLQPSASEGAANLLDVLPRVTLIEGEFKSVEEVRQHLTNR